MKKITLHAVVCALALGLAVPNALADPLTLDGPNFLGYIVDGIPSNPEAEVGYINTLLDQPLGTGPTLDGTEVYGRSTNLCGGLACPDAVLAGSDKSEGEDPSNTIDVTGFTYLLGKYDAGNAGSLVWYVGDLSGEQTIPAAFSGTQYGLSHWSLYNPTTSVPDGGMTLMLLGGVLVGLEGLRRKLRV